jgi:hypothetical protein
MELELLKNTAKSLVYRKKGIIYEPIKSWELENGQIISIYQGNRGTRPDLDFIVKYLSPGKRLRTPSHTHWIVDLLMKSEANKSLVKNFIGEWHDLYEVIEPFSSLEERINYNPFYKKHMIEKYNELSPYGEFNIEFLSVLIELFSICEKRNEGAYMFKNMLGLVRDFCNGKRDFYQVVSHSKRV